METQIDKLDICIIVPVYNAEQFLAECLDSIREQTYTHWTCILVNDGSTDNSQQIIDTYCSIDDRFTCLVKENEKSAFLARKYALMRTNAEWIICIDADDAISPSYMEMLVKRQLETNADIVTGRLVRYEDGLKGGKISWQLPLASFDMNQVMTGQEACLLTLGGWQIGGSGIIKRDIMLKTSLGPYMNSDEYEQRERLLYVKKYAFADVVYYYRANVGTSDKVSVRMFDRTLVDIQLEEFVHKHFPDRKDKIKALVWQRYFNLIYLSADFKINESQFSVEEIDKIKNVLRYSYQQIDKLKTIYYYPIHALMLLLGFKIFCIFSKKYVQYKRSHGGTFWYQ